MHIINKNIETRISEFPPVLKKLCIQKFRTYSEVFVPKNTKKILIIHQNL